MKKIYYLALLAAGLIAINTGSAQEAKTKGFYVRAGGGYSFGTGKVSGAPNDLMPAYNRTTNVTYNIGVITAGTEQTDAAYSLGQGVTFSAGGGYMLNSYLGFELSADYLYGSNNTVKEISNQKYRVMV